jgi:aminoglycoside phosphotransferase (APT) family kinase protein
LVHGDLHPAQILAGEGIAILDWERAHRGDPEEDLGNLAAHLYWAGGDSARPAWRALALGYREAGGAFDPGRLAAYARLSLLRVLAVHAWRDRHRARALETGRWERWLEECEAW